MSDPVWHLRVLTDPFTGQVTRADIKQGYSLGAALDDAGLPRELIRAHFERRVLSEEEIDDHIPAPGAVVYVDAQPGVDPGTISAAFASFGALLTAQTVGGAIARIVVGFALQWAVNALFTPSNDSFDNEDVPRRYSITGARNRLTPFQAIPFVAGVHRFTPPYGAQPYTEIVGVDQYLRILVIWGYGPIALSDLRIGNTPIEQFDDVLVEHDLNGGGVLGLYPKVAQQENLQIELQNGVFSSRTTAPDVDEIGITVTLPEGLYFRGNQGQFGLAPVRILANYRLEGGGWVPWFNEVFQNSTTEVLRFSWRLAVPRGRYEIRVTVDNAVSTDGAEGTVRSLVNWTAIRSFQNEAPVNKPGVAATALRIRGTEQLNGLVDEINGVVEQLVPVWNGASWAGSVSSFNPAAIYRHALTSDANPRKVPLTRRDDAILADWYNECVIKGYRYSRVFNARQPFSEVLREIAAAGFASPKVTDNKWGVVIDRPRTVVRQHFTPRNIKSFQGNVSFVRQPHALRVQFINADADYADDEIIVYAKGYGPWNATEFDTLPIPGATIPAAAFEFGRFALASGRLRPEDWALQLDWEYLIATRGDLVRWTHDAAAIGILSARIVAIDGNLVSIDGLLMLEDGKTYVAEVRDAGGYSISADITSPAGQYTTVELSGVSGMAVGDLLSFGETDRVSILCLVEDVLPGEDLGAEVRLIPYQPAVYDPATAPNYEPVVSAPVAATSIGPASPQILSIISDEAALPRDASGVVLPMMLIDIAAGAPPVLNARATVARRNRVRYRIAGRVQWNFATLDAPSGQIRVPAQGSGLTYEVEVQAEDAGGGVSAWTRAPNHTVTGLSAPPPPIDTLRAETQGGTNLLQWTYLNPPSDLGGFEVRHHPDPGVTDWGSMAVYDAGVPAVDRSLPVPDIGGTFGVKPVDTGGRVAEAALFTSGPPQIMITDTAVSHIEQPTFPGVGDRLAVEAGALRLVGGTILNDWPILNDLGPLNGDTTGGQEALRGTYEFGETDLGAVFAMRVETGLNVFATNLTNTLNDWPLLNNLGPLSATDVPDGSFRAWIEISTSDAAVPVWSDYERIVAREVTARHLRFLLVVETDNPFIQPGVDRCEVAIKLPQIEVVDGDLSPGAVVFDQPFKVLRSLIVTGQDMQQNEQVIVTGKSVTGFTVSIIDSGGSPVARTFDYQAIGFGQEVA